ncbi:bile acid:sodium symporter [Escherichia coli]|nr:bile acid:sodium symporter [Escherichia coli]
MVYTAFSEAVVNGIWHKVGWGSLLFIVVVSCVLLAIVIVVNVFMARRLGFNKADEITIVFCGSKKSLANGIPMANILFPHIGDRYDGAAPNDFPSDPIDGLCGAGASIQTPDRTVTGTAGKQRR